MRDTAFDAAIALLFPEIQGDLATSFGTAHEPSAKTLEESRVDEILNAWTRTGRVPLPLFRSLI